MAITQEIAHESYMMNLVVNALRDVYDTQVFVTDIETNETPPKFPAVCFYRDNDQTSYEYRTLGEIQKATFEYYTCVVYSKDKNEAKQIVNIVDTVMNSEAYVRIQNEPIWNVDASLFRRLARWRGTFILDRVDS